MYSTCLLLSSSSVLPHLCWKIALDMVFVQLLYFLSLCLLVLTVWLISSRIFPCGPSYTDVMVLFQPVSLLFYVTLNFIPIFVLVDVAELTQTIDLTFRLARDFFRMWIIKCLWNSCGLKTTFGIKVEADRGKKITAEMVFTFNCEHLWHQELVELDWLLHQNCVELNCSLKALLLRTWRKMT